MGAVNRGGMDEHCNEDGENLRRWDGELGGGSGEGKL